MKYWTNYILMTLIFGSPFCLHSIFILHVLDRIGIAWNRNRQLNFTESNRDPHWNRSILLDQWLWPLFALATVMSSHPDYTRPKSWTKAKDVRFHVVGNTFLSDSSFVFQKWLINFKLNWLNWLKMKNKTNRKKTEIKDRLHRNRCIHRYLSLINEDNVC